MVKIAGFTNLVYNSLKIFVLTQIYTQLPKYTVQHKMILCKQLSEQNVFQKFRFRYIRDELDASNAIRDICAIDVSGYTNEILDISHYIHIDYFRNTVYN